MGLKKKKAKKAKSKAKPTGKKKPKLKKVKKGVGSKQTKTSTTPVSSEPQLDLFPKAAIEARLADDGSVYIDDADEDVDDEDDF